jgi:hypothetical protein
MGKKLFDRRWFDSRQHGRHDVLAEPRQSVERGPCGSGGSRGARTPSELWA